VDNLSSADLPAPPLVLAHGHYSFAAFSSSWPIVTVTAFPTGFGGAEICSFAGTA
jgi:hypothetical protein